MDLKKAMGDAAWAVVKAQASAGDETPHERIVRLVHEAGDSLISSIGKEFDESQHQRDEHGKFVGLTDRTVRRLQQRIASIRATLPAHQHAAAISTAVARARQRASPEGQEVLRRRAAAAAATRARNTAARQASEAARQTAATRPPEAQAAEAATAPNTPPEAQAAAAAAPPIHEPGPHPAVAAMNADVERTTAGTQAGAVSGWNRDDQALHNALQYFNSDGRVGTSPNDNMRQRLVDAGVIRLGEHGGHELTAGGRNILHAGGGRDVTPAEVGSLVRAREANPAVFAPEAPAPTPTTAAPAPTGDAQRPLRGMEQDAHAQTVHERIAAIPARNSDPVFDNVAVHDAINYFRQVENSSMRPNRDAVGPDMRQRLMDAGVLEPLPGVPGGHRLTSVGQDMARNVGAGTTPNTAGEAVRAREDLIARGETPPAPPAPPRQESYYERQDRLRREEAERRAREPGGSPANPIVPEKDANGKVVKGPGGTCASSTYGKPDGTYVLRERSEHKVTEVKPVKLNMVDTPENMRNVFGPKMPDTESLEKVWGHEEGGITCKVNSVDAGRYGEAAAVFNGTIYKKDPQAPGGQRAIGRFTRSFKKDDDGKLTAGHDYFKIDKADDQGGGLGANMIGHAFHAYKEMGVDRITVHPAWVGPYAWASFGYNVNKSEIKDLQEKLVPFLKGHGIPEARAKEVAGQCTALHHFADLDLTPDGKDASKGHPGLAIHHISDERNRDGSHPEYDLHLGAKFLLGPGSWSEGTIELSNPRSASYERVKSRLGVKG